MVSPIYNLQIIYLFKMLIPGYYRKLMLLRKGGNPNIILRNWSAFILSANIWLPLKRSISIFVSNTKLLPFIFINILASFFYIFLHFFSFFLAQYAYEIMHGCFFFFLCFRHCKNRFQLVNNLFISNPQKFLNEMQLFGAYYGISLKICSSSLSVMVLFSDLS